MAVGYVIPTNVAQSLPTLAAALDAELNISAAVVSDTVEGCDLVEKVKVTGTAAVDITNAITAVGNCQLRPGTAIV